MVYLLFSCLKEILLYDLKPTITARDSSAIVTIKVQGLLYEKLGMFSLILQRAFSL